MLSFSSITSRSITSSRSSPFPSPAPAHPPGDLLHSLNKLLSHLLIPIVIPTRTTTLTLPPSILLSIFESLIEARFQDLLKTPTTSRSEAGVFRGDRSFANSSEATEVETEIRILEFLERSLEEALELDYEDDSLPFSPYKSTRHRKERIIAGLLRLGEMMGLETNPPPPAEESITPPRFSTVSLPPIPRGFETPRTQRVSLRGVLDEVKRARALESDGTSSEGRRSPSHVDRVFLSPSKREVRERAIRNWEANIREREVEGRKDRRPAEKKLRVEALLFDVGAPSLNTQDIIEEVCTCNHHDNHSSLPHLLNSSSTSTPKKYLSATPAPHFDQPFVSPLGVPSDCSIFQVPPIHRSIRRASPTSRTNTPLLTQSQDPPTSSLAIQNSSPLKAPRISSDDPSRSKHIRKRSGTKRRDSYLSIVGDSEIERFEAEKTRIRSGHDRSHSVDNLSIPREEELSRQVKIVEIPLVEMGGVEDVREGWEWTQIASTTTNSKLEVNQKEPETGEEVRSKIELRREYEKRLEAEKDRLVEVLRKMKVKDGRERVVRN